MTIFSIDPHTLKYFKDRDEYVSEFDRTYQGTYNFTPIYPLYTFVSTNRFNYMNSYTDIIFITMLPVKRLLGHYLIEVRFRYELDARVENSLSVAIDEFNKFCESSKKEIDVNNILE